MKTAKDVLKFIKENDVKYVDFRFTDPRGKWQHVTFDISIVDEEAIDEGIVDDLDDHLPRRDRAQHFLPDSSFRDPIDEVAGDRESDIGFKQRDPHLAHRFAHVALAERAAPAKPVEYAAEPIAQRVEHSSLPPMKRPQNAKYAGGRNLVGQRASVDALIDVVSLRRARPSRTGLEGQGKPVIARSRRRRGNPVAALDCFALLAMTSQPKILLACS